MTFEAMSEEVLARAGSHQDEARSDPDLAKVEKRQKSPHREAMRDTFDPEAMNDRDV